MNKEQVVAMQKNALGAFVAKLTALGGTKIPFGGELMSRERWANCIVAALIAANAITSAEAAEAALVVLDSSLANPSALMKTLIKDGVVTQEAATAAAVSFADELAKQIAARSQT